MLIDTFPILCLLFETESSEGHEKEENYGSANCTSLQVVHTSIRNKIRLFTIKTQKLSEAVSWSWQ